MRASTWNLISYLFGAFLVIVGILRVRYLAAPRPFGGKPERVGSALGTAAPTSPPLPSVGLAEPSRDATRPAKPGDSAREANLDDRDTGEAPTYGEMPERESDAPVERGPNEKRHLRWGIAYVLLGLFLVISTYVQMRRGAR
jgi:hypothetical protein